MEDKRKSKNFSYKIRVLVTLLSANTTNPSAHVSFPKSNGFPRNKSAPKVQVHCPFPFLWEIENVTVSSEVSQVSPFLPDWLGFFRLKFFEVRVEIRVWSPVSKTQSRPLFGFFTIKLARPQHGYYIKCSPHPH